VSSPIGAVNATEFYGVHMLSGGQDGTICIWDAKRWECLVTLKAHKYPCFTWCLGFLMCAN
jgi:WD40 repeat protein